MRTASAIRYDILFQFRHGFYYAYALVSTLYILLLRLMPADARDVAVPLVVFSDPGALGFFFIGGIVLLEKGQGILKNLFITPYTVREYLWSKTISLTLLATLSSLAVAFFSAGFSFNPLPLIAGVVLSSFLFTLLGLTLVARVTTINSYMLISPVYMAVFFLPVLENLNLLQTPLVYLIPGKASLLLIGAAFNPILLWQAVYALLYLAVWVVIAFAWAGSMFDKQVMQMSGGGKK